MFLQFYFVYFSLKDTYDLLYDEHIELKKEYKNLLERHECFINNFNNDSTIPNKGKPICLDFSLIFLYLLHSIFRICVIFFFLSQLDSPQFNGMKHQNLINVEIVEIRICTLVDS